MVDITFDFNQAITVIQTNLDEPIQDVINKYIQKTYLDPGSLCFLYNGVQLNPTDSVGSHMNDLNKKDKKMTILVKMLDIDEQDKEQAIAISKDIICPNCKKPCKITFDDYSIKLSECIFRHENRDIKYIDFENTQKVNESQIICDICKIKNKGNCPANEFFRCLVCKHNLCLICRSKHNLSHNIIQYNQRNYICQDHFKDYNKYCKQCNKNICFKCQEHKEHQLISLEDITINKEEKKKILDNMKVLIDSINQTIKEVIVRLNLFSKTINKYYEINNTIYNNCDEDNRNFQIFENLKEIKDNTKFYELLKYINNNNNIKDKLFDILNLYESINKDKQQFINIKKTENNIDSKINDKLNETTIIYKINNKESKLKLFDEIFVKNNKDNCYILINGEKSELKENIDINKIKGSKLEVKLYETKTITDMSYMFYFCNSLLSLPDFHKWDTKNVTNMSCMFSYCSLLDSIPHISRWDTKNVTNMSCMFSSCTSLKSLPDISKWDTKNVTKMNGMFDSCTTLKSLPDISKWDTKNVTTMSYMFYSCIALKSLPDISKWDTKNNTTISSMFNSCSSLKTLPDISKWDTKKVTTLNNMFSSCTSLKSLPEISKWDTKNVTNMSSMFD